MKLGLEFFRSKVAQRIFLLFISSALIPIIILAFIHYKLVVKEIYRQNQEQIHEISKSLEMDINKHLNFIRQDIEIVAALYSSSSFPSIQSFSEEFSAHLQGRLNGLLVVPEKGDRKLLFGQFFNPPDLTPAEKDSVRSGEFLIRTEYLPHNRSRIYLSTSLSSVDKPGEILWADVNPEFLWFMGTEYPLQAQTELCILDQSHNPLFCTLPSPLSFPDEATLLLNERHASQFEWTHRGKKYLAGYRPVPLNQFIAGGWKVVINRNKDTMFKFEVYFRNTFPLVILASLWLVLFLSTIQIRKSLIPLERIKEGTKRIANQDFDSRVKVNSRDEFEEVAESFNAMARQLGRQFKTLTTMVEIDRAILSVLDTDKIVNTVLTRMREVFPCKGMSITIIESNPGDVAQTYIEDADIDGIKPVEKTKIHPEDVQMLRKHPETLIIKKDKNLPLYLAPLARKDVKSFLVLPIFLKLKLAGIITLGYSKQPKFAQEDLDQARQLADQVAVAFSNARLIEELNELNWGTLTALARAIDAKSPWTAGHSERSTQLAIKIGEAMKLSQEEIDDLHRGGLLHDIGKLGISPDILDKPAKLTLKERKMMEKHVQLGARILEPISAYSKIIPIVLQHHERFNGNGYPDGIEGDSISLNARIFAVADTFEAMTSDRPYRKAFDRDNAIGIIKESAGTDFDPKVVKAFLKVMSLEA